MTYTSDPAVIKVMRGIRVSKVIDIIHTVSAFPPATTQRTNLRLGRSQPKAEKISVQKISIKLCW